MSGSPHPRSAAPARSHAAVGQRLDWQTSPASRSRGSTHTSRAGAIVRGQPESVERGRDADRPIDRPGPLRRGREGRRSSRG
eukprot:3837522-Pyramimonas_sp.AAC.1